jgi:PAS domain S-box-containing protein
MTTSAGSDERPDPALFKALFETAPDAMIVVNRDGSIVLANPQAERLFGYEAGELTGSPVEVLLPDSVRAVHVGHRNGFMANPRVRPMGAGYELTGVRRNGQPFPVEIGLSPIESAQSTLFAASIRDISETHRVRQALTRARYDTFAAQIGRLALESSNYESAIEKMPALVASALAIRGTAVLLAAPRGDDLRVQAETGLPQSLRMALPRTIPKSALFARIERDGPAGITLRQLAGAEFATFVAALGEAGFRDAAAVLLQDRYQPMGVLLALSGKRDHFDRDALHFLQSVGNILAAAAQRSRSEEQLAHSQRLDAVGQLTGGIAHDFNNLLTVISGNLQILEAELADRPTLNETIDSALRAVDRGAVLTRKLLAFARRQRLVPRPVLPTQVLSDLQGMLRRTLGEHIAVSVELGEADKTPVFADPGELEAALINLALNARDAMPQGGALTISVRKHVLQSAADRIELPAGDYVVFSVVDTGLGMAPDVLARALEPFFTTKAVGKGNGLGLSMVYGFARQSGGQVAIESHVGQGTRVDLYLPAGSKADLAPPVRDATPREGRETVLVVEDEAEVRGIALAFLRSLGYTTYEASDAEGALALLRTRDDIELLFSDIVLGSGMNGFDLVREARALRPRLPVLLTSGYERAAEASEPVGSAEFDVLRKPYRREQLAAALRKTLDADRLT